MGASAHQHVYEIVRTAVMTRRPISALYNDYFRLLCPHRLGRNKSGQARALCYQYGGESESGLKPLGSQDNWRCIAIDKLKSVELRDDPWQTAANHSRTASCVAYKDVDAEDFPNLPKER